MKVNKGIKIMMQAECSSTFKDRKKIKQGPFFCTLISSQSKPYENSDGKIGDYGYNQIASVPAFFETSWFEYFRIVLLEKVT